MADESSFVPAAGGSNPYAPKRTPRPAKRAGESRAMSIGAVLLALAGAYPATIWLTGWWVEQYHWQPNPAQQMWFLLGLGPACLLAVFSGLIMFVVGATSWLGKRSQLERQPLSFGRLFTAIGMIGATVMCLELLAVVVFFAAFAQSPAPWPSQLLGKWFPPTYTVLAVVTLAALLIGWIFTPRQHSGANPGT